MEEGRILPIIKKPKVLLDKRFPFVQGMEVGDKGQLDVDLQVTSMLLELDEDGNEFKNGIVKIVSAKRFGDK